MGCLIFHKWKIIERRKVQMTWYGLPAGAADEFLMQCERCGNLKRKTVE